MEENTRWRRLEELFTAAADLPQDSRTAFIEQERDPELRSQLRALLDHDPGAQDRITQVVRSAAPTLNWTGRRIGPYRIVREVGRGGMGLVFEALRDDDEYRKTVALKIAPWWRDLDLLRERFKQERQILAGLEHPNVARFLDGGTHDGVPYFAMEFIEGRRITDYARHLPLRRKIELFREVCSAVQHAHQSLVVHRDLKPANILVTQDGVPKLLDFGIAKLLTPFEDDGTATRVSPWTPDYASPEQVRARPVTTRTDVYSLGLVLFEMLTDERAQVADTSSPLALDRSICETETPAASSKAPRGIARQLAGDLDTIIAKATEKDPDRRYASVAEFSDDLGRYLEGRPVRARAAGTIYRTAKFVRRHWLPLGAAAFAVLALAAGAIGFAWQARVANRSRLAAEQQRDRAAREHTIAEEQRDAARREQARAEELAREANAQRKRADDRTSQMSGLAQHAVFDLYGAVANLSGSLEARHTMLQTTIDSLEKLRTDKEDDPEFVRTLADAYAAMGQMQGNPEGTGLGNLAASVDFFKKALAMLGPLAARYPSEVRYQISMISPLEGMALILEKSGKRSEANEYYQRALGIARRAAVLAPNDPHAVEQVGIATANLSLFLQTDPLLGEPYARESLEIYSRLLAKDPDNAIFLDAMVSADNRLASAELWRHNPREAARYARNGVKIRERLLELKPDDTVRQRELWVSYGRLADISGGLFESLGDTPAAVEYYRKSIVLAERMVAKDPRSQALRNTLANTQLRLGLVLTKPDERPESLELLSQAAQTFEAGLARSPQSAELRSLAGGAMAYVGIRLREAGDRIKAREAIERALNHFSGPGMGAALVQQQLLLTLQIHAVLLAEKGERNLALDQARKAADIFKIQASIASATNNGVLPRYWSSVGEMYDALADAGPMEQRRSDRIAAKEAYQKAAAEWRKTAAPNREAEASLLDSRIAQSNSRVVQ